MSGQFPGEILTRWPFPTLTPLGASVGWYGAGLDPISANRKNVYSVTAAITPIANPVPFDVNGNAQIVLGGGGYKRVIWSGLDETSTALWTTDNINSASGSALSNGCVDTIADLKAITEVEAAQLGYCYVGGYYAALDGGGGWFRWNAASAAADDGGYTISPSDNPVTGRWIRQPDENGDVRAASFGYIGTTASDQTNAFMAADGYCAANNLTLRVGPGTAATITNIFGIIYPYAPNIIFESGSKLTAKNGTESIVFRGVVTGTLEQHFKSFVLVSWSNIPFTVPQVMYPEWIGATEGDDAFDNTAIFGLCASSGAPVVQVSGGNWFFNSVYTLPVSASQLWKVDGFGKRFDSTVIFKPGIYADLFTFGKDIKVVGEAKGDLTVENDLIALNEVTAATDVVAGRHLLATAGTGTKQVSAGGRLYSYSDDTGISTSGTGATNLVAWTLPANTCHTDLDTVVIEGGGTTTSPSPNAVVAVKVGAAEVLLATLKGNGTGYWHFKVTATRLGSIAVSGEGFALLSPTADFNSIGAFFSGSNVCDWSSSKVIQVIGQCASSGSMTQHTLTVDFVPAPI